MLLFKSVNTIMERMTGIEPATSAWEADVLPLNYIRIKTAVLRLSNPFEFCFMEKDPVLRQGLLVELET